MNGLLIGIAIGTGAIVVLLLWSVRGSTRANGKSAASPDFPCLSCKHLGNFNQVRQALEVADLAFVDERLGRPASRKTRAERRRVVLQFLDGLNEDFESLVMTATRVAALAPELDAKLEARRLRLIFSFRIRYAILRVKFKCGFADISALGALSGAVGSLAMELEQVVATIVGDAALPQNQPRSAEG